MLFGGGALLYFGAEWLVRGAAGLALAMRIRPIIVGLTIVAYGTSAPELIVGLTAAAEGKGALALGNSVGSNIANLGLILGLTALISRTRVDGALIRREVPFLLLTTLALPVLLIDGSLGRVDGILLLVASVVYTVWMLMSSSKTPETEAATAGEIVADAEAAGAPVAHSRLMLSVVAVVGLALLVVGGKLFVDGAVQIALSSGMSERVVGLTIVAVGTSMPELAASIVAAMRGHGSIAVGNVIGSNIFNVLLILGAAAMIKPIVASWRSLALDLGFLIGITGFAVVAMRSERVISRTEAFLFLTAYAAFLLALVLT